MGNALAIDDRIRILSIERVALRKEVRHALVRALGKAPCFEILHSHEQRLKVHIEKDRDAISFQMRHRGLAVYGAAAGGNDVAAAFES